MDHSRNKRQNEDDAEKEITLDECVTQLGFGKFQVKLFLVLSVLWVADAMEIMMIGFISPALACEFNLTDSAKAVLTTMVFMGMLFGAFAWGIIADRYGRKKCWFFVQCPKVNLRAWHIYHACTRKVIFSLYSGRSLSESPVRSPLTIRASACCGCLSASVWPADM